MTKFLKKDQLTSSWYEIDAKNAVVGRLATVISKRDVPPKPILVSEDGENQSIYRYNYSGEPLEEDFLTAAIAVQEGYVSVSVLDYSLNSKIFIDQLNRILNE